MNETDFPKKPMKEKVIKYLTLLHQFDIINSQLLFIVKKRRCLL